MAQKRNQEQDITVESLGDGPGLREADIDSWHRVLLACAAVDESGEPAPERAQTAARLRHAPVGARVRYWVARDEEGVVVGTAQLRLFEESGRSRLSRCRIAVHPERRRQGIGSELLAVVQSGAREAGRTSLGCGNVTGTAAPAALGAWGFSRGSEYLKLRLRVADCDQDALRAVVRAASEGYHLARWQGIAPADLAPAYAEARATMADAPSGGVDRGRVDWDAARVRELAELHARRGEGLLTVAALYQDEHGEEAVAGFSEVILPGGTHARQSDTAVARPHRGRGLGLWVKAAMLQWLLGAHPEVAEVITVCAESNRHMIAINEQLGFELVGREYEFTLALTP
ncbi:GNAT family N-acetyltransferase [Streptacidiphilus albus]|uniref:GNAT family N-acetyltransferase n=1 Tax=Streptacidiphilus albus TaxID=105425 RepID=UPI00054B2E4B|nr:GNAT family N-acetyltransferase [Streptacidiphilus albus]